MQETVDASFEDVDLVLFVLDARERLGAGDRFVARRVFSVGKPLLIAVNKIARLTPGPVLAQMKVAAGLGDFHALHPVSAKTRQGVGELRDDLVSLLPEGPLYFPVGQATDLSLDERVAEVIREKALHLTREEVPHAISVEVDELGESSVRAFVVVETESQKGILVGKKGAMIKEVGTRARPEVEALVGHPVFLELIVKVRPRWRRDPRQLERLGL
jgi:GTP-binding protein Era